MIRANCRARFTAADFDFVVRTLARSQSESVSLVDLLADSDTRDSVLDSPRLVDAILSTAGQLRISSHFYFSSWLVMFCARPASPIANCPITSARSWKHSRAPTLLRSPHRPTNRSPIYLRHAHRSDSRYAGTGVLDSRARRQLLAVHQRHLSREHAARSRARRARPRLLRTNRQPQLSVGRERCDGETLRAKRVSKDWPIASTRCAWRSIIWRRN